MSRIDERMQDIWYGGREPGLMLRTLAVLYGAAVGARRAAYGRGWMRAHRVGAPVIVVGNISVGGSGKTPLVIALVEHLRAQGWKPGVVSRGYGRRSRGQVVVDAQTSAQDGGDEPVLIARRCGVPVVVNTDRVAAARRAVELGADIVVADDGLQHYRLHRDIEIEVIDGARRRGNAMLLPAGPLREPVQRASECDMCVANGGASEVGEWPMQFIGDTLTGTDGVDQPLDGWRGRRVHAVAGIGNPDRFFRALRKHGLDVVEHAFDDHHAFVPGDLLFDEDLPVVMTEKDWVKCAAFAPADAWRLPVRAECPEAFFVDFVSRLASKTGKRRD